MLANKFSKQGAAEPTDWDDREITPFIACLDTQTFYPAKQVVFPHFLQNQYVQHFPSFNMPTKSCSHLEMINVISLFRENHIAPTTICV